MKESAKCVAAVKASMREAKADLGNSKSPEEREN